MVPGNGGLVTPAGSEVTGAPASTAAHVRRNPWPLVDISEWKITRNRFEAVKTGFGMIEPQKEPISVDVKSSNN